MTIWYLARATGLVALIAFSVSTALGALGSAQRGSSPRQLDLRYLRQLAHRSAAVTGLLALAAHITLILVDVFTNVSLFGAFVPFTAGYRPLAVGLGSLAVYVLTIVAVSGASRGRLATSARAARSWRLVHLLAYVAWALSMGHGILAGTDTGTPWTTVIYAGCGLGVIAAVSVRLHSLITHPRRPMVVGREQRLVRSGS